MNKNKTEENDINGQNIFSDVAVLSTLGTIVALLAIAIGIGTWQCVKRKRLHGSAFSRLAFSQRSTLSRQSTLSQEQFQRLLHIYHRSGPSATERSSGLFAQGVLNERPLITASDEQIPERSFSSQKPLLGSTRSSVFSLLSPEHLRTASDSTPTSNLRLSGSIQSGKALDVNVSPHYFREDDLDLSDEQPRTSNFVRSVGTRNRHGVAFRPPPRCYGRSASFTRTLPQKSTSISWSPDPGHDIDVPLEECEVEPVLPEPTLTEPVLMESDIADQKPFYFAWPEEAEEEVDGAVFSPLLLKASVESIKDGMNVGDESILSPQKHTNKSSKQCHINKSASSSSGTSGSIPSTTYYTDKGVVPSKHVVLPYGLKSTWV